MNILRSRRLELVSMGPALLEALLAGEHARAAQIGGFQIPNDLISIAPNNEASLAVAHSMGFSEVGSHIDKEDGLELYFERRLDRWPDEWGSAKVGHQ